MRKEEDNEEEEEKEVNKMLIEEGGISCEDEGDEKEVKQRRIEEVDCSNEGKSMRISACSMLSSFESKAASLSSKGNETAKGKEKNGSSSERRPMPWRLDSGSFGNVPPELFHHILKFLFTENLVAYSLVCRFLNFAASDESLWRNLYSIR